MASALFKPVKSLFSAFAPMFRPPFDGLWIAVLLYYAWCFLVFPDSQVLRGNFPDPDDYMYLTQVMDWVKGQGWYDNVQHRLNPPDGVMIHFSRLAMIPMAGLVLLFEKLGLGPRGGSILMALLYPLILLGGFLITLRKLAESFLPKEWAGVTAYVALFSTALMYMFQPGHVDHHGLIIWVIAAALLCALRMMEEPGRLRFALWGGVILALGLNLALEILPWVLIISTWLGLFAVMKGRAASRQTLVFALSLHLSSIIFLLLYRRPEDFFMFDVLTYSVVYVFLTGGIAVAFAIVALVGRTSLLFRAAAGTVGVAVTGGLFLHRFPELIAGPYGAMDPELVDLILDGVNEAMPLTARFHNPLVLMIYLSATLLALGVSSFYFWKEKEKRWSWGLWLVTLLAAFLLTTFYQCRYSGTTGLMTVIPLSVLLQRGFQSFGLHLSGRPRFFAELGLLLLVGPLLPVFLPAMADGRSFNKGIVLFPVTGGNQNLCDTYLLEQVLRDSKSLGNHPRLIMNDMGLGPELLFRTSHSVLAAPFLDTAGNIDAYRFFSTPYPEEAKAIALRRHIDLVVSCAMIPMSYLRTTINQPDADVTKDFAPHFIQMLIAGRAPSWLRRVRIPGMHNFVIYEMAPQMSEPGKEPKPDLGSSLPAPGALARPPSLQPPAPLPGSAELIENDPRLGNISTNAPLPPDADPPMTPNLLETRAPGGQISNPSLPADAPARVSSPPPQTRLPSDGASETKP